MPTPIFLCGGECGIAAIGTASGGVEHWVTATAVTIAAHPLDASRKAIRHQPGGSGSTLLHTLASAVGSPAVVVVRFRVYFTTFPNGDVSLGAVSAGAGILAAIVYESSDNTLQGDAAGTRGGSFAISTGVEYLIDARITLNATRTVEWRVDGAPQTTASVAAAASSATTVLSANTTATTGDFYVDDLIFTATSADYPIGAGSIVGLYPNGDRPNTAVGGYPNNDNEGHYYDGVADFGKGAGGATDLAAYTVESTSWQSLANPLSTSIATNFISDRTGGAAQHLVHTYADMPAATSSINGAMFVATSHSASATGNNFQLLMRDDAGGATVTLIDADLSEVTITVPVAMRNTDTGGTAWTVARLNSMRTLFQSQDVNPDVYLDGVCVEVDYVPVVFDGQPHVLVRPSVAAHTAASW